MIIKKRNFFTNFLAIVIFITNITQVPQMIDTGLNSSLAFVCWIICLIFLLLEKKFCFRKKLFKILLISMAFFIYILCLHVLTGNNYLSSSVVYPFFLSNFVFLIGFLLTPYIKTSNYVFLFYSYIISGIIVAIAVYVNSFFSGFSWNDIGYAYASKNSVSQIILTVVILLSLARFPKKRVVTLFRIIMTILLVYLLMMLKSRASILGIVIIIIAILFNKNIKKRYKCYLLISIIIFIFFLFVNNNFYKIFINNILLANKDIDNLNSISSGRTDMYKVFPKLFLEAPFFGRGIYYIEAFPLSLLLQYGVMGSLLISFFLIVPIGVLLKAKQDEVTIILWVILGCYYINGFFEELSPLGPGVKCYMLWLLFGLVYGKGKLGINNGKKKS